MLHAIQYSLIEHINANIPSMTEVAWHYGGMELPKVLPFATVENLNTSVATLDKRSTHISNEYHFQIGVFARNAGELAKLQSTFTETLTGDIPLFNTDGEEAELTSFFMRSEVRNVVPMPVESTEGLSGYHRLYVDVQIFTIQQL